MQMTSYLHDNTIWRRETFGDTLVKFPLDYVILWHVTSFSYIFPYYDAHSDMESENTKLLITSV